jgi:UPF0271 protein
LSLTTRQVDLNADLGEGFPNDREILDLVSSASLACAAHAGDRTIAVHTLREMSQRQVVLGAHPGFADRAHFGRRPMLLSTEAIQTLILGQVEWLSEIAAEVGMQVRYLKPHGALYNQAQCEVEVADGVLAAASRLRLPVLGQPGSVLEERARTLGLPFITEGFPDRRYRDDGRLVSRSEPGAVLTDPEAVEAQVVHLVDQGVATLCIHGDDPRAVANARAVRSVLERQAIVVKGFV